MAEQKESIRYADLPLISVLDQESMDQARLAIDRLIVVKAEMDKLEKIEKDIKEQLEVFQMIAGTNGLRYGDWAYSSHEMAGRESLDRTLLIEAGVNVEVIKKCTKAGRPYQQRDFKFVGMKEKKEKEKGETE